VCYGWAVEVNAKHPAYLAAEGQWRRARAVLAGEDAVKAGGEDYLARLDGQSDGEYKAYVGRACFFGASARTLEEYLDLVFRRRPELQLGSDGRLGSFVGDCDGLGTSLIDYCGRVLREVLSVGRAVSLVMSDGGDGAVVRMFRAEDVLNWRTATVDGQVGVVWVLLRDGDERIVVSVDVDGCYMATFRPGGDGQWERAGERGMVRRLGVPIGFVPLVVHGAVGGSVEPGRLPLGDIISANLDLYRLDADYKHGLHFAALPTAWVSGFDGAGNLKIGSATAWESSSEGAKAGFLEFSGAGLAHIEKAIERTERRMALLGARMLEAGGAVPDGSGVRRGEMCGLGSLVGVVSQSLTRVLRLARWWMVGDAVGAEGVSVRLNGNLGSRRLSGDEINALVGAWKGGAISRESMLDALRLGEVLPDGRTVAEERALIHRVAGVTGN